ncbi:MAG: serine hydrolase [Candidatus Omnitrophica bacterium]|nr:serine hydrolase [Candidatus Omnitrophota bacterium]
MKSLKIALSILLVILVLLLSFFFISRKKEDSEQRLKQYFISEVKKIAVQELSNASVDYSVYVKSLKDDGKCFEIGRHRQFPAASLIKLPILASAIKAVSEGKISLGDKITIEKKDITGGSGILKSANPPYTLSFEKLLELMIAASDNTATNKVIKILGQDYIIATFEELKLNDTVLGRMILDFSLRNKGVENYTSSYDTYLVLEKLYHKELYDPKLCELAIDFLKNQKVRDRIPRFLPEDAVIANKTGLERGVVHDAGIVYLPDNDYIICVLVKNERVYARSKKFIAQVSLLTYNFMVNNNNP